MRITAFLLLSAILQLTARGTAQITLSEKHAPLEKVLKEVRKQSGYTLFYDQELVRKEGKPVDIEVKKVDVAEALRVIFEHQVLTYEVDGKTILVKEREAEGRPVMSATPATVVDVKGKVTNQLREALVSASVIVQHSKIATLTNERGDFVLKGVPLGSVVEISYLGYQNRVLSVEGTGTMNVELQPAVSRLDEAQVIAYGSTTQRMSTGNVSTVKSSEIAMQPVSDPLLALAGRVPGLQIEQSTGFAGSGVKVHIQGLNSIGNGNDPLYVIDGVPYISQFIQSLAITLGGSDSRLVNNSLPYGNPLSFINPADIESIEVLKDADATAIYGSRAANGAILITTKKGRSGDQRVEFNVQQGWGKVTRRMDVLNLRQYLDMRYEALRNDGIDIHSLPASGPGSNTYYDLTVWDTTHSTDWQKELIGHTSEYTDFQATVGGGTVNNSYTISSGYHRETSVMPSDFDDQRGSVHFQMNNSSANQKFKLSFIGNYMADVNKLPAVVQWDLTQMAIQLAPDAPAMLNPDGSINWAPSPNGNTTWDDPGNPMAQLLDKYLIKTNNLVGSMLLSYQIVSGLNLSSSFGYTNMQVNETMTVPLTSIAPESRASSTRVGEYGYSNINSWVIEPQLRYTTRIKEGKLEALFGASVQDRRSQAQWFIGNGYVSDAVLDDIHAASSVTTRQDIQYTYKYAGFFGRVNYNWNGRYIANINLRRDGSSRFGYDNSFHNFGSVATAWIFSEEPFLKKSLSFLSFGKLKASYGLTGNDQIGDFLYLSIYNPVSTGAPYQGISALQLANIANPYLHWEETRKLNIGGEFGLCQDRIIANANYFLNRSSNQLLDYPLSAIAGFTGVMRNFPATVQNTGWELSLNSINAQRGKFKWSTNFNLTLPSNKLISFPGIENTSYASYMVIGQPISITERFHLVGVDPLSGRYYFSSKSNPFSPKIPDDQTVILTTTPKFFGGLQNSFTYRGFQLDFLFQFVSQKGPNYLFGRLPGIGRYNQPIYVLNRWQRPGDNATIQRFNANLSLANSFYDATSSDAAFSDASYVRLKNAAISWLFPDRLLKSMHLKGFRVFIQGQNLLTITGYKGLDPETLSSTSLPPLRVITMGAHVQL